MCLEVEDNTMVNKSVYVFNIVKWLMARQSIGMKSTAHLCMYLRVQQISLQIT